MKSINMDGVFSIWTFVYVIAAVGAYLFVISFGSKSLPLPPGPPKSFVFGNAREIPAKFRHLKFSEWSKVYGKYPMNHRDSQIKP